MEIKTTSGFAPFSNVVDRFMPGGYKEPLDFEAQLGLAKETDGLDAIALDYPMQFEDPVALRALLDRYGLELALIELGIYGEKRWRLGSFSANDVGTRREAIGVGKRCLDVAAELGVREVLLWPGQDGYEYPFQADHDRAWSYLVDGIGEVAQHRADVRIGVEYKPKEPRTRCFIDSAAKAVLLCEAIGLPNVGVTVDLGHSLAAHENPGQAVALCNRYGRLFMVHVNDNYGDWDSDLLVGQVNLWLSLEFFYWLAKAGYDDWFVMDFFPYREDGKRALEQCIHNTRRMADLASRLVGRTLETMQAADDPVAISEMLWREVIRL